MPFFKEEVLQKLIKVATIILSVLSVYYTYKGAANILQLKGFAAFGIAIISGVFSLSAWFLAYQYFPDSKHKILYSGILTVAVFMIFSLSTMLAILGMGGDAAIQKHNDLSIQEAEQSLNQVFAALSAEQSLVNDLTQYSNQFSVLEKAETGGEFTGVTGRGDAAKSFGIISAVLNEMSTTVRRNESYAKEGFDNANQSISKLRDINYSDRPMDKKIQEFARALNEYNAEIAALKALSVKRLIQDASQRMENLTLLVGSDTDLGNKQRETIRRAQDVIRSTQNALSKATNELKDENLEVKPLTVISASRAIFTYWDEIPGAWAAGLGMDFCPLFFLLILTMVRMERKDEKEDTQQRLKNLTIKELLERGEAIKLLQEGIKEEGEAISEPSEVS